MHSEFSEAYIESTLSVGVVYKITAPELINTDIPHYFLLVAIADTENYMIVSTTQIENKISHLKNIKAPLETLVYISPNKENGLTKDSYFNCNDSKIISKSDLLNYRKVNKLKAVGNFSLEEYSKIREAIKLSDFSEVPEDLLIHASEVEKVKSKPKSFKLN